THDEYQRSRAGSIPGGVKVFSVVLGIWNTRCTQPGEDSKDLNILYKENWTKLAEKEMIKFERDVIRRYNLYSGGGEGGHEWNFSNSFLYSLTLITTIGKYWVRAPRRTKNLHSNIS
ncbi:uncharacterized protein LOC113472846, partial [Diaphorina citri]|uniref:Uncharacterized protein LOC113472846 n=1 Tax=Diaphorina citri TaxID=121845 RepID=A0A3Q0JJ80_DIACI